MKIINVIILVFLFFLVNTQVPKDKVINTCGIKDYREPINPTDCKEDDEICCYVEIKGDFGSKRFCVSSPSKIDKDEVKDDIKNYTSYELKNLICNKSSFIKNWTIISFLLLLIIF